jgi:uncharacterized membrane protein HdeD (DUF308 family)
VWINKPEFGYMQRGVATTPHRYWVLFPGESILLVIFDLAAIVVSPIATLAVEILFGWLFLTSEIAGLIAAFRKRRSTGFRLSLVSDPRNCGRSRAAAEAIDWRPLAYPGSHCFL